MAKKTLLAIVQDILLDVEGAPVNSIGDSQEAEDIAKTVERVYYNIITNRSFPEHEGLIKLTALSDNSFPTHFTYPTNVSGIQCVWYDKATSGDAEYVEITYCTPLEFLSKTDYNQSDYVIVADKQAGTSLRIGTDAHPNYYTSFDDEYIVMDSYDSTIDNTLQESKVRAYGTTSPVFEQSDSFVPDLDANVFPYLINEASSVWSSLHHGGVDPKVEQASRRQKAYIQDDKSNTLTKRGLSPYGR